MRREYGSAQHRRWSRESELASAACCICSRHLVWEEQRPSMNAVDAKGRRRVVLGERLKQAAPLSLLCSDVKRPASC